MTLQFALSRIDVFEEIKCWHNKRWKERKKERKKETRNSIKTRQ